VDANRMLGFGDDMRQYSPVQYILNDLKIDNILLMTNNPRKCNELNKLGINIVGRIPILANVTDYNSFYLQSKTERMAHIMNGVRFISNNTNNTVNNNDGIYGSVKRRATTGKVIRLPFRTNAK
jgi:3,4-dihydroxy 2-butanone 4-phosphate synthase/GTP cyclohydrolase II